MILRMQSEDLVHYSDVTLWVPHEPCNIAGREICCLRYGEDEGCSVASQGEENLKVPRMLATQVVGEPAHCHSDGVRCSFLVPSNPQEGHIPVVIALSSSPQRC